MFAIIICFTGNMTWNTRDFLHINPTESASNVDHMRSPHLADGNTAIEKRCLIIKKKALH